MEGLPRGSHRPCVRHDDRSQGCVDLSVKEARACRPRSRRPSGAERRQGRHQTWIRRLLRILASRPGLERGTCGSPPAFSMMGRVPLRKEAAARLVTELAKALQKAGELERGPFSRRDLRRTAETHRAALGIASGLGAQTQSHGLGGLRTRHDDRHDAMPEKRAVHQQWSRRLRHPACLECCHGQLTRCGTAHAAGNGGCCRSAGDASARLRPSWPGSPSRTARSCAARGR